MERFIEIRSYDNYIYANIVLGKLQAAGIHCHLKDEYTVTIDPLLSPALGGIKIMVLQSEVDRALELLEETEEEGNGDS